ERRSERPEEDSPHAEGPGKRLEVEVDVAAAVEAGGRGEAQERLVEERVAEEVGVLALHDGEPRDDHERRHRRAGEEGSRADPPRRPGERAARREPGEERHRDPDWYLGVRRDS